MQSLWLANDFLVWKHCFLPHALNARSPLQSWLQQSLISTSQVTLPASSWSFCYHLRNTNNKKHWCIGPLVSFAKYNRCPRVYFSCCDGMRWRKKFAGLPSWTCRYAISALKCWNSFWSNDTVITDVCDYIYGTGVYALYTVEASFCMFSLWRYTHSCCVASQRRHRLHQLLRLLAAGETFLG